MGLQEASFITALKPLLNHEVIIAGGRLRSPYAYLAAYYAVATGWVPWATEVTR